MKNEYRVENGIYYVFTNYKGERKEIIVDQKGFELMDSYNGTWTVYHNREGGKLYARMPIRKDGRNTHLKLHRLLTNPPKGSVVDHRDGNPLNNRLYNLRVVSNSVNLHNAEQNQYGVNGVSWYTPYSKWRARVMLNKKEYSLGYHENIEDAKEAVIAFKREKGILNE